MSIGYSDFQAYAQWKDTPSVSQFGVSFPTGNTTFGPFLLGNFGSLFIYATAGASLAFVQVNFFDDQAMANAIGTVTWSLAPFTNMSVAIPAVGNYYNVVYGNSGAGASTATVYVYPTNMAAARPVYLAGQQAAPLLSGSATIVAGGNSAVAATQLFGGPASLSVANSATAKWHALIDYYQNSSGSYIQFAAVDGSTGLLRGVFPLILPPALVQVTVFNDDAANHGFVWSLVAGE
ncbi:MAG TPA: hypothetical protein VIX86_19215 [Streptosporangiaceae bacterium]